MAPDIPIAMYRSGATTFPVCPTWQSLGAYPESTAAREAPIAAPSRSASGSNTLLNSSLEPNARPPETTTLADVSSGRVEADLFSETYREATGVAPTSNCTILPDPPLAACSKLDARTVASILLSDDLIVSIALPA